MPQKTEMSIVEGVLYSSEHIYRVSQNPFLIIRYNLYEPIELGHPIRYF